MGRLTDRFLIMPLLFSGSFLDACDQDLVDATTVHIYNFKTQVFPSEGLAGTGDSAELTDDETTHRMINAVGTLRHLIQFKNLFQLIDVQQSIDQP